MSSKKNSPMQSKKPSRLPSILAQVLNHPCMSFNIDGEDVHLSLKDVCQRLVVTVFDLDRRVIALEKRLDEHTFLLTGTILETGKTVDGDFYKGVYESGQDFLVFKTMAEPLLKTLIQMMAEEAKKEEASKLVPLTPENLGYSGRTKVFTL